jgi:hypothetical protein
MAKTIMAAKSAPLMIAWVLRLNIDGPAPHIPRARPFARRDRQAV